jgi:hypothetical protein
VLEPGRTLTLAERGGEGAEVVVGAEGFRLLATMNPGGDYGKKELSPALSNRFTQVRKRGCWVAGECGWLGAGQGELQREAGKWDLGMLLPLGHMLQTLVVHMLCVLQLPVVFGL